MILGTAQCRMLEQADEHIRTEVFDHHGIVAGTCRDIGKSQLSPSFF